MEEGYDCKNRYYKEISIKNAYDLCGEKRNSLTILFRVEYKKGTYFLAKCDCGRKTIIKQSHFITGRIKTCGLCYNFRGEDLSGKVYNNMQVLNFEKRENKTNYWKCKCLSCGKERLISANNIKNSNTIFCECSRRENLIGRTYNFWKVLNYAGKKNNKMFWKCQCICGKIKDVRSDTLKNGTNASCGCIKTSRNVRKIEETLKNNKITYKKEYVFPGLISPRGQYLRYDFAILMDNNIVALLEYDGEQHYKRSFGMTEEEYQYRKICDTKKDIFALKNNILLYRIPYWTTDFSLQNIFSSIFLILG